MIATMLREGAARARERARLLGGLFLIELGVGLVLTIAVAGTFDDLYADRPLFARGVAGDLTSLTLALSPHRAALTAFLWAGIAVLAAYKIVSFYLSAGLTGALAGRGFAATAGARFGGFLKLGLWSLLPYALAAGVGSVGLNVAHPRLEDLLSWETMLGIPLAGLAPGLALWLLTACAVDYARGSLVLAGGRLGSGRALLRGFRRVFTRGEAPAHYLLYVLAWLGVSALYVGVTYGRPFAGALGAWALFALRQATAAGRLLARAAATGGQVAALELDVLEVRQVVERPVTAGDVVGAEVPQPVEGKALDGE